MICSHKPPKIKKVNENLVNAWERKITLTLYSYAVCHSEVKNKTTSTKIKQYIYIYIYIYISKPRQTYSPLFPVVTTSVSEEICKESYKGSEMWSFVLTC